METLVEQTPLVSIIIPAYNSRQWLEETVDSALGQTYSRCEIVVVDDGSTDGTGEWLTKRYGDDVTYVYKENGGLASARNMGMRHSRGEYIQFLDADDLILPEKVVTHVEYLSDHPEVGVVYCHCLTFDDGAPDRTGDYPRKPLYRSGKIFADMIDGGFLLAHMLLSRREALESVGGFDESLTSCEDWDFWLRVAWSGVTFKFLDGPPLALYRVRHDSMSHEHVNHGLNGLRVLSKAASYSRRPGDPPRRDVRRAIGRWRFAYGRALAEAGRLPSGVWNMLRGVLADPRELDYKVSYLLMALVLGPGRAGGAQRWVKAAKDSVVRRERSEGNA